ncbi:glycoside hydrolase family 97 C-terminal domain-containing protein [Siphonobacter sp. BAB-5385]|uniref:glycoside hydrolase family 97 C-terminal domain-containing protein n=1 Tax=Siphonobacter sp. BAB-5385 TaxID=1864822 RepID=UPI0020CDC1A1|nr:glycoside hydrolase family 97 C-terminal domain-containing protein [Siphonobacter sp. BAB-5385]
MFGLTPNNLTDVPAFELDFLKKVPTVWDETVYVDGYPGQYAVIARRHRNQWYIAGVNAQNDPLTLKIQLPMLAGKKAQLCNDNASKETYTKEVQIKQNGELTVEIQPNGGFVIH